MQRRWPTVLRGLLAALALAALVVGVPLLLVREVGWPLPTTIPAWSEVAQTITTGAIEDATIIKTLAVLVWLAWANFAAGVIVEASAIARDGVARRIAGLGPAQHLAANLFATISVAVTLLTRPTTPASAAQADLRVAFQTVVPEPSQTLVALTRHELAPETATGPRAIEGHRAVGASGDAAASLYEVQFGDTLWDLSDRLLGDGMRWREIRDLNVGRRQSDGTTITADTEDLRPGWALRVPGRAPSQDTAAASSPDASTVVVERGDTLWDLADQHLEDAYRWPEIYEENRGHPQPDGGVLTDPGLIQPGWELDLPTSEVADAPSFKGDAETSPPATNHDDADTSAVEPPADTRRPADSEHVSPNEDGQVPHEGEVFEQPSESVLPTSPSINHVEPVERAEPAATEQTDEVALLPIAAAGTLAAGLVLTLDRLRRARLRRRQANHRIPLPTGEDAAAEGRLRAHANPDADRFLNLALRELSADHRPGPPVVLASHGPADVAVHLAAPSDAAPDDWDRHDGDHTWSRHRLPNLDTLYDHVGTPSRFPAMVTLGSLLGGRVGLLNLAHAGCLHLNGSEGTVRRLMSTWALELATTPRADALDVVAVGIDGLPDGLERLTRLGDADQLREVLGQPHSKGTTNLPRTVILAADLPSEISVLLRTTSELRGDLASVVSGLQPRSGDWSLHIEGRGRARLAPEDITFDLLDLGEGAVPLTAKLIEQTLHDPEQLVQLPDDEPEPIDLDEPTATRHTVEDGATPEAGPTTEVRVLGPVEIVGVVVPFRTNKTIELIVYLALHRSGASADTILEALWPGQDPRPARLYTGASRVRKSLGAAPDGSPHLPDAELGRYRLADSVALDYGRFTAAVASARRNPSDAIEHLRRALMLVRGVPLSATATEYAWATNEVYALAQEVVDAAHDLAQLCLEAERYDDAIWAAERGLLADPLAEVLVRDLIEAAVATGNTARAHAAMKRLRRDVSEDGGANDADDWLHPATIALFNELATST